MKRLFVFLLSFSLSTVNAFDLSEVEDCLPFYVEAAQAIDAPSGGTARVGQRGVLIRPLEDDRLLVNFGREGRFIVTPDQTNLPTIDFSECLANGPSTARINQFLFNRLMRGSSGWTLPLGVEEVRDATSWIFIYGVAEDEATHEILSLASKHYSALPESKRDQTLLVYLDRDGDKAAIQNLADELNPSIAAMPGYLSKGYFQSFEHVNPAKPLPQAVELYSSGRIKNSAVGVDDIAKLFAHPSL